MEISGYMFRNDMSEGGTFAATSTENETVVTGSTLWDIFWREDAERLGAYLRKHPAEMVENQANEKASYAWMTFIEQVESIGLSTYLMILATSEIPYTELPYKIRGFFKELSIKTQQYKLRSKQHEQ